MKRLLVALVSMPLFFALGAAGGSALNWGGTYAAFQSSASVSGELTVQLPENPYVLPERCGNISDYSVIVYLDQLGTNAYNGGNGSEVIFGTNGDDRIQSGRGTDCVVAGGGNDFLQDLFGADNLFGGDGDDTIIGDHNDIYLDGGSGDDFCIPRTIAVNCENSSPQTLTVEGHHSIPTIDLEWAAVSYVTSYSVYRAERVGGPFFLIGSSPVASYADVGVLEDKTYYYRVTAVFYGIESDPSAIRSASVPSATATPVPTLPASPTVVATAPPPPSPTATTAATATNTPAITPSPTKQPPTATATFTPIAPPTVTATPTPSTAK